MKQAVDGSAPAVDLRREEVASHAAVSPIWYTWLEQGRGGAPSAPVLDRISRALMPTEAEREHLFLLGLGRPDLIMVVYNPATEADLEKVRRAVDADKTARPAFDL